MTLRELLSDSSAPILLDGGFGTLLQEAGLRAGELPETWNCLHPDRVIAAHRAYREAGSRILCTNTFGANALKYNGTRTSLSLQAVVEAGVDCAREAIRQTPEQGEGFVALDIGPTGRLLAPLGDLDFDDAVELFAETIRYGVDCGVDLITVETMNDLLELKAAVVAAKETCSLPICATAVFDRNRKLLTGADPAAVVALLEGLGVTALGVNCSLGPEQMQELIPELLTRTSLPLIVKPNAGLPETGADGVTFAVGPDAFAARMQDYVAQGARLVGGCCGTNPDYIRALQAAVADRTVPVPAPKPAALCGSGTHAVDLRKEPIREGQLTPEEDPAVAEALLTGDVEAIIDRALDLADEGAELLTVCADCPDGDEEELLLRLMRGIQEVCDLPLTVRTGNPDALEQALRHYNGKAAVLPPDADAETLHAILPILQRYGGVLRLPRPHENPRGGIVEPKRARIERILAMAETYGLRAEDVVLE